MPAILVTGGTGYIGSHTVVQPLRGGADGVILDINRLENIIARRAEFILGDIRDRVTLRGLFNAHDIDRMCADTWRWQSRNPLGFVPDGNTAAKRR